MDKPVNINEYLNELQKSIQFVSNQLNKVTPAATQTVQIASSHLPPIIDRVRSTHTETVLIDLTRSTVHKQVSSYVENIGLYTRENNNNNNQYAPDLTPSVPPRLLPSKRMAQTEAEGFKLPVKTLKLAGSGLNQQGISCMVSSNQVIARPITTKSKPLEQSSPSVCYLGDRKEGQYHGRGTLTKGSITWHGEWCEGDLAKGTRKIDFPDFIEKYEGEFDVDLLPHGEGVLTGADYVYTGSFKLGHFDGMGTLVKENGQNQVVSTLWKKGNIEDQTRVTGKWCEGKLLEREVPFREHLSLYKGDFNTDFELDGEGTWTYTGWKFEGTWKNGILSNGKLEREDGAFVYEGPFTSHLGLILPHGEGRATLSDGSIFEGRFLMGFRFTGKKTCSGGTIEGKFKIVHEPNQTEIFFPV